MKRLFILVIALGGCRSAPVMTTPPALRVVADGERMNGLSETLWQPDYQKEFYRDSHVAPTAASRKAAERQMLELLAFKRKHDGRLATVIARTCLPDGRFDAGGTRRTQAIVVSVPWSPSGAELSSDLYAEAWFRSPEGTRVPNPKREVWYVLPGENRVRKVSPEKIRYRRVGEGAIAVYPGGPSKGKTFASVPEAFGLPPDPPEPLPSAYQPLR